MNNTLEPLKKDEAEIFVRTSDKILKVKLPSSLVKKLKEVQMKTKAEDILEVLLRSSESMIDGMYNLDSGKYTKSKGGENVEIHSKDVDNK